MKTDRPNIMKQVLRSPIMLFDVLIPLVAYNLISSLWGMWAALVFTVVWAVLNHFTRKRSSPFVIIVVLLLGSFHLVWEYMPQLHFVHQENVAVGILSSLAIILACVFQEKVLDRSPIGDIAEAARPSLLNLKQKNPAYYRNVWKRVSTVWCITYAVKILVLLVVNSGASGISSDVCMLLNWPMTLLLIVFSIKWPQARFQAL